MQARVAVPTTVAAASLGALGYLASQLRSPSFALQLGNRSFSRFIRPRRAADFRQITGHVYTSHWLHYTSMVIRTPNGFIVVDPANTRAAHQLKDELDRRWPGVPVHTLIYSHFHKDHTEGGAILEAARVVGHEDVPRYLADYPGNEVVLPTELLAGEDTTLDIDGVDVEMLYLPEGHTTTNFAVHVPSERTVYVADLAAAKSLPFILVDMYLPAAVRNLEKVATLDVDHFVASHFLPGTKRDLEDGLTFLRDVRAITQRAFAAHGPLSERSGYAIQAQMYKDLKAKYGHLHGFDDLFVPFITRAFLGELVGY